jgi:DNA-binding MarR family transcriptional regulator
MKVEARRQLLVLAAVERDQTITQRTLSAELGVALGLTNIYIKRLIRQRFVTCVTVPPNRLRYRLTRRGLAEKARLSAEYMAYSLNLYRDVRQHLSTVLRPYRDNGAGRIAMFGCGDAAELAYVSLREHGLEPVAIFSTESGGTFLGMPVRSVDEWPRVNFDRLIVATFDAPDHASRRLIDAGIPEEKLVMIAAA